MIVRRRGRVRGVTGLLPLIGGLLSSADTSRGAGQWPPSGQASPRMHSSYTGHGKLRAMVHVVGEILRAPDPFRRHAGYLFAGGDDLAVARYVRLLGQRTRAMSSRGPPGERRRRALHPAPQRGDDLEGLHGFRRTADVFPGRETLARWARHSRSPVHRHDHRVKIVPRGS
jgi:hypothetical protein